MESCILNKKGFSILEVTVVAFIVGAVLSMVISSYVNRINNAKYQRTVNELTVIAQSSVDYFNSEGSWPTQVSQLAPEFMPNAVTSSPFGTNYQITFVNKLGTVSVLIPSGIAQNNPQGPLLEIIHQGNQDQIEISQTVKNELTSRLNYDLKYVY
jgi:type II secretory pathway pseudopilin PulG